MRGLLSCHKQILSEILQGILFCSPSETRVSFSSQEDFLLAMKNKIHFFLVVF